MGLEPHLGLRLVEARKEKAGVLEDPGQREAFASLQNVVICSPARHIGQSATG